MPQQNAIIYDTTLRDGMQGMEVNFSLMDKIQIAHALDDFHVDYIEGGFPLSNDKESAFFDKIKREQFSHAKIVAFGSTRRPEGKTANDPHLSALLNAGTDAVTIVAKTWTAHVEKVLNTSLDENITMLAESVAFLKERIPEVFLDLEHFFDGYKENRAYALKVLEAATQAGADCLVLCDTNGGTLPHEVVEILDELPRNELNPLGVHFHDDSGTAVANTLLGLQHGAPHLQGTINGWGERCGNANLCTIMPNICFKTAYTSSMEGNIEELNALSRFIAEKANIIPEKRAPYVGLAAFSHKAGQHADVIQKAPELMEHLDGKRVGNKRRILLSELAGKSTVLKKMSRYGNFSKNSPEVEAVFRTLKAKENDGYEYEAAEASFDLLMRKSLQRYTPIMELNNYHLESYKTGEATAKTVGRIFMDVRGKQVMGAGLGNGPVDTLDKAIRDALPPFHPFIEKVSLIDYRVRVLNPEEAAAARVRVFITSSDHNGHSWDTVGVSENIVEASWEALVDSFEYYFNNFIQEDNP